MTAEPLPNASPLSCEEAIRQVDCLVEEGSLKNTERALLMSHLEGCANCRGNLERRRQLDARLREAFVGLDTKPDFTERLLALIPKREGGISSAWRRPSVRASGVRSATPDGTRAGGASWWPSRTLALPAAAILLLVVGGWWVMRNPATSVPLPTVATCSPSMLLERDGRESALESGRSLQPGDVLTVRVRSETDTGSCELSSQGQKLCAVRMAAGARLLVHSRGRYELRLGEAYFEVNPERPGAKDESFDVETPFGHVLVVGTSFGIIVASAQANTVTVVVDKGVVSLKPLSGQPRTVLAGQECDLRNNGGTSTPRGIAAVRLPRLRPTEVAVESDVMRVLPRPAPQETPVTVPPQHVNWAANVSDLNFRGCTLAQAIQRLEERTGAAEEWPILAAQAAKLAPDGASALLLNGHPMRAEDVMSWLAREQGLRFTPPIALRPATPHELAGPTQSGEMPPELDALLDSNTTGFPDEVSGAQALELLSKSTGLVTLTGDVRLGQIPRRATWRGILEHLALASEADWAWYDGVIYVAPESEIEALTRRPRTELLPRWLGAQPLPVWELSLKRILSSVALDRQGRLTLSDKGLLSSVVVYPDERGIQYQAGVRGTRTVNALYRLVNEGSAPAADAAAVLNELDASGTYRTLEDLIALARGRAPVIWEGGSREFPMQAFTVRRMPLGRALERAAWQHGLGLRLEPGRIVVDASSACYGEPVLQAIPLATVAARCPKEAFKLPSALAREAQACWPDLLKEVEWLPLHRALIFQGDARQLAAVQKVLHGLEQAVQEGSFDADTWRMPWRTEVARSLAEPFGGDGTGTLSGGSFVGLLRQSGLFIPLKTEILVDPVAMRELASKRLPSMDVRGRTMGQVLSTLAQAAGLRMVIEDEVIWLKP